MKLGIMQPYFLPYIGYFQLINAVDVYVIYDDVNFIKGGWINRNRILLNNSEYMLNIPMLGASSQKKINEIGVSNERRKVLQTIEHSYKRAPYFSETFDLISDIVNFETEKLSVFLTNSLIKVSEHIQIKTSFILSSEIDKNNTLHGENKVINICKVLGATKYYNAIGGYELYDKTHFEANNIALNFIKSKPIEYKQFNEKFFPWLSILDILMFNSIDEIRSMLNDYDLI